ncbi:hypothetical protein [Endothiovibrio diazotrophicus]
MQAVTNNTGLGSLFNKARSIGTNAVESSRPTLKERQLGTENRDLSSENTRLKGENRDLRTENRDLKTQNQSLQQEAQSATTQEASSAQPGAPQPSGADAISGEVISARRSSASGSSSGLGGSTASLNEPPSAPSGSPAGFYVANAGDSSSGGVGTLFSAYA